MRLNEMEIAYFNENLGKLFYAISACDGEIHAFEVAQLNKLLKFHWLAIDEEQDRFRADDVCLIGLSFEWMLEKKADPMFCFKEFEAYKQTNEPIFNKKITTLVLNTAYAIATAFEGLNEAELNMLKKLTKVFAKNIAEHKLHH